MLILVEDEELSKEVKMLGFPIEHKHKLCCLRQELIDSFVDSRYMMFIKYAAFHLQQLNIRKNEEALNNNKDADKIEEAGENKRLETEEAKKIVESITDGSKLECKYFVLLVWHFQNLLWCFFLFVVVMVLYFLFHSGGEY